MSSTFQGRVTFENHPALALFDTGATHNFISITFMQRMGLREEDTGTNFTMHTPMGESTNPTRIYTGTVRINGRNFSCRLVVLPTEDFDIILGIQWLGSYKDVLNCATREIRLQVRSNVFVLFHAEIATPTPIVHELEIGLDVDNYLSYYELRLNPILFFLFLFCHFAFWLRVLFYCFVYLSLFVFLFAASRD